MSNPDIYRYVAFDLPFESDEDEIYSVNGALMEEMEGLDDDNFES